MPFSLIIFTRTDARAVKGLWRLHTDKGSWKAVGAELGFNQGYVNLVAHGKRLASRRLLTSMGILKAKKAAPRRKIWQRYGTWTSGMICYLLDNLATVANK